MHSQPSRRRRAGPEICDVSVHPDRAETDGICFTPVLMKRQPLPRTIVGLGNPQVLQALLETALEPQE